VAKEMIGRVALNEVTVGDCRELLTYLPDNSIDVIVTSPPYWGQRLSEGTGVEDDPRDFIATLATLFSELRAKLKPTGIMWINLGDAYNTPVNWRESDHEYSSLGADKSGLSPLNSAYTKPRHQRRAFVDKSESWLTYGNLLALPQRLIVALCDEGWMFRGEVIWKKRNPMPEGRCRRPHRQHEPILLFSKEEQHWFRTKPPVGSVWEFANEKIDGLAHYSRFPVALPQRCIEALGESGPDVVVLDPFMGSGTTGLAALSLNCSFVGFEIDKSQAAAANERIKRAAFQDGLFDYGIEQSA
jgi:DNA modification methylase